MGRPERFDLLPAALRLMALFDRNFGRADGAYFCSLSALTLCCRAATC
jgi:hypothetical protein